MTPASTRVRADDRGDALAAAQPVLDRQHDRVVAEQRDRGPAANSTSCRLGRDHDQIDRPTSRGSVVADSVAVRSPLAPLTRRPPLADRFDVLAPGVDRPHVVAGRRRADRRKRTRWRRSRRSRCAICAQVVGLSARRHLGIEVAPLLGDLRAQRVRLRQRPEIELPGAAHRSPPSLAALETRSPRRRAFAVGKNDSVLLGGRLRADQAGAHVLGDPLGLAVSGEPSPPAPAVENTSLSPRLTGRFSTLEGRSCSLPSGPDQAL